MYKIQVFVETDESGRDIYITFADLYPTLASASQAIVDQVNGDSQPVCRVIRSIVGLGERRPVNRIGSVTLDSS